MRYIYLILLFNFIFSQDPFSGEINYSYIDINPIGGLIYEMPIAISLSDIDSNPVADSTNVYFWIEGLATPWSIDSTYLYGDTIKWGDVDINGDAIPSIHI